MSVLVPPRTTPYTLQEMVDIVYQKFVVEGMPPSYDGNHCLYRSQDGKSACAIGWLIPDDRVLGSMIQANERAAIVCYQLSDLFGKISPSDYSLFNEFQMCHDSAVNRRRATSENFAPEFTRLLRNFTKRHSLVWPGDKNG